MKASAYRSYLIGVLHSAQWLAVRGEDTLAIEIVSRLLEGESIPALQGLAATESVRFSRGFWADLRRARVLRMGGRG